MLYLTVLALEFAPVVFEGLPPANKVVQRSCAASPCPLVDRRHRAVDPPPILARDAPRHRPAPPPPSLVLPAPSAALPGLGRGPRPLHGDRREPRERRGFSTGSRSGTSSAGPRPAPPRLVLARLSAFCGSATSRARGQLRRALQGSWLTAWTLPLRAGSSSTVGPPPPLHAAQRPANRPAAPSAPGAVLGRSPASSSIGPTPAEPLTSPRRRATPTFRPSPSSPISLGVVAAMALVFLFFVEHLRVWESPPAPVSTTSAPRLIDPVSVAVRHAGALAGTRARRSALACAVGALLGARPHVQARDRPSRSPSRPSPVQRPRAEAVLRAPSPGSTPGGHRLVLTCSSHAEPRRRPAPGRDGAPRCSSEGRGARDGTSSSSTTAHQQRLGGVGCLRASCATIAIYRVDRATSCAACHRRPLRRRRTRSTTNGTSVALGRNGSCESCHRRPKEPKTRAAAKPCDDCHARDVSRTARFQVKTRDGLQPGVAPGYRAAMHGLCISCHREHEQKNAVTQFTLSRCPNCHRDASSLGEDLRLREGRVGGGPGI